jgi:hypothetical protein
MAPQEFQARLNRERTDLLWLLHETRIFLEVRERPRLAPAFAEGLILDITEDQARERMRKDRAGAAGFALLVERILATPDATDSLAARVPSGPLTPFYVLSSLVIEAEMEDWDLPDGPKDRSEDSSNQTSDI